jgi:CrcB protein
MLTLLVGLAAGAGAVARYLVDIAVSRRAPGELPVGTFVVNITGSFVLGLVVGLGLHHGAGSRVVAITGAGFAGGYTTWSTWAWESLVLAEGREWAAAATNVLGSVAVGLAAAAAGLGLARL